MPGKIDRIGLAHRRFHHLPCSTRHLLRNEFWKQDRFQVRLAVTSGGRIVQTDDDLNRMKWREMDDASRAVAYSPSSALDGDIDPYIEAYAHESALSYEGLNGVSTHTYGPKAANSFDIVRPEGDQNVGLLIFIHGGYWQLLSKRDAFGPARDAVVAGMAYATVDYTLAPDAKMDQIVDECTNAVRQIIDNAADWGIDPDRIALAGSSAGAHLAAMCCLKLGPDHQPAATILLSGIFELEPLIGTYVNEPLGLDVPTAKRNSPAHQDLGHFPRTLIAWGRQETDEFKRQSRSFAAQLRGVGIPVEMIEMAARNHFDIVHDVANESQLGRACRALVGH